MSPADFIRTHTAVAAVPGLSGPPVWLHLATELTPLWQATEPFLQRHGVEPPFWAFAWPGSVALAAWMVGEPEAVRGRTVWDFAAGCGLAGIVAARLGARVTAVEIDPLAGEAIRLNAALNAVEVEVRVGDLTGGPPPAAEVLLAGDVGYDRRMVERIWPWFGRAVQAGTRVVLADPGRAHLPAEGLRELAVYDVPTLRELEDRDVRRTRVLERVG